MTPAAPDATRDLTVLDWVGAALAALGGLGLLAFPAAARSFEAMFEEFGQMDFPLMTRLALSGWFPAALGVAILGGLAAARWASRLRSRRFLIFSAFALGLVGLASCIAGLYLPIFSLADKIRVAD